MEKNPVLFMIDTGAISLDCWQRIRMSDDKLDEQYKPMLTGVNGSTLQVVGMKKVQVPFEGQQFVISVVVESLQMIAIMGMDLP